MHKKLRFRTALVGAALGLMAIAAVACGSDEPAATPTPLPTATPEPTSTLTPTATPEPHDHGSHDHGSHDHGDGIETEGMSVMVMAEADPKDGVNVHIMPSGFEFTPENANGDNVDGEGHAHIWVNGEKLGRVYTEWFHLVGLEPGEHEIVVTLNANDHSDYLTDGEAVSSSATVTVPEPSGMSHGHHDQIEAESPMSVEIVAEADEVKGANVTINATGFTFAPENVNGVHVDGEGHAHIYVDGVKLSRVYGDSIYLGNLTEGMHEIKITLNANTHADYTYSGEVVEATVMVHILYGAPAMEHNDDGHMDGHSHSKIDAPHGMSVALEVEADAVSGANIRIIPTGFTFTPEKANGDHVAGEGHAHVYVDGVMLGRVYTEWFHIGSLEPGMREIRVTLNNNAHSDYAHGDDVVEAVQTVMIHEHDGMHSHADTIEALAPISLQISAEADSKSGANLTITATGFTFTPENVNGEHVDGEGHAHVYVDGVKVGRVYGESIHIRELESGMHEIRVTLNANTHADYTVDGEVVEATVMVHIP